MVEAGFFDMLRTRKEEQKKQRESKKGISEEYATLFKTFKTEMERDINTLNKKFKTEMERDQNDYKFLSQQIQEQNYKTNEHKEQKLAGLRHELRDENSDNNQELNGKVKMLQDDLEKVRKDLENLQDAINVQNHPVIDSKSRLCQ